MLPAELPYYFCGIPFRAHQVGRNLHWLLARGEIRQVIRGVYVDIRVLDSPDLRADGRLVVPPEAAVCGRAAAWLHGIYTATLGPDQPCVRMDLPIPQTVELRGLKVTSPAATAIELVMHLERPFALSAVDALLHSRVVTLSKNSAPPTAAYFPEDGNAQAHQILRHADHRAASPAESWLRLRLLDAGFGRPDLQIRVDGPSRTYRLDLGYPDRPIDGRRLGLEDDSDQWDSTLKQQRRDETRRAELETRGRFLPCQHPRLPAAGSQRPRSPDRGLVRRTGFEGLVRGGGLAAAVVDDADGEGQEECGGGGDREDEVVVGVGGGAVAGRRSRRRCLGRSSGCRGVCRSSAWRPGLGRRRL